MSSTKIIGTMTGDRGFPADQDPVTHGMANMQHPHDDIHEGYKYMVSDNVQGMAANATQKYLIKTGTMECHLLYGVDVTLGSTVQFFEGPTVTVEGTPLDAMNQKRSKQGVTGFVPTTKYFKTPTVTGNGTLICIEEAGGGTGAGKAGGATSVDRNEHEWVLDIASTYYLIIITALSNGTDETIHFHFYEPQED